MNSFLFVFMPFMITLGIILLFVISKLESHLKYYVLIGATFYISLSLITSIATFTIEESYTLIYFFIAAMIENIFFALGLGAKQKKNINDRNQAQEIAIKEHQKNLALQNKIKDKLDKEVALKTKEILELTKKNEAEQRKILATQFSKRTLDLKMRSLQKQMNPHFLFNALNSIKHFIIKEDQKNALIFLQKLSILLRRILDNSQKKEVTLSQELDMTKLYLEVENMRLLENIQYEQIVDSNVFPDQINIPPLILQPFIENSIWHGLSLKKGFKKIRIQISKNKNQLLITIEDNGIGRERAAIIKESKLVAKKSYGIKLTKQRIAAYTSHLKNDSIIKYSDLYHDDQPSGTKVTIRIPY